MPFDMEMLPTSTASPLDCPTNKRDARRARHDAIRRARHEAYRSTSSKLRAQKCRQEKGTTARPQWVRPLCAKPPLTQTGFAHAAPAPRVHHFSRKLPATIDDESDVYLAHSNVPLPSDNDRDGRRRPSLEREDAFCDASTFKPTAGQASEDAQIAHLYQMGLLYDDKDRTEPLDLNAVLHDEPVYAIRPAKHGFGRRSTKGHLGPRQLPLDLSFSDLGDDDAIAKYITASAATTPSEIAAVHEQAIGRSSRNGSRSPPLRVIYELDTLRPSFDVETSQPPDLTDDDMLTDYDCFSESDLQETPSQREVHDGGADTWVMLD